MKIRKKAEISFGGISAAAGRLPLLRGGGAGRGVWAPPVLVGGAVVGAAAGRLRRCSGRKPALILIYGNKMQILTAIKAYLCVYIAVCLMYNCIQ